jgi:hypothetical protein
MTTVNMLVEGPMDEAAAQRLLRFVGFDSGVAWGKKGCDYLKRNITKFSRAAHYNPLLVLLDFADTGEACPPAAVSKLVLSPPSIMVLRLVVPELESWLLADRTNIAKALSVSGDLIPIYPETLTDPKQELINIARRSRSRRVRDGIVPVQGSTANVGPEYVGSMLQFIDSQWDVEAACQFAPSLDGAVKHLRRLKEQLGESDATHD